MLYLTTLRLNIFQGKREIATFPTIFWRMILFSGWMALFQSRIGYYLVNEGYNQDKILLNKVTAKTDKQTSTWLGLGVDISDVADRIIF